MDEKIDTMIIVNTKNKYGEKCQRLYFVFALVSTLFACILNITDVQKVGHINTLIHY